MPNYDFLNTQTGEQFTERMSMNEREEYLANNPHIQQLLTRMNMFAGSPKNDDGWKENMSRIAEAHPNSALAEKVGGRSSSTVKATQVLDKHGIRKGKYSMDL